MPDVAPPVDWPLLVEEAAPCAHDAGLTVLVDHLPWGAVARRGADGTLWRALDDDSRGPLLLGMWPRRGEVVLRAWGARRWATDAAAAPTGWTEGDACDAALTWAGLRDSAWEEEVLDAHPVTRELRRRMGPIRLSGLIDVQEAVGRAVVGQLVQFREAERSAAALARLAGREVGGLRAWPTPSRLRGVASWDMRRRCGVSLRGAGSLHAAAADDARLRRLAAERQWEALDRCLRALPGVGVWTSAEARLALGDPDAVPFGDYHLPNVAGHALSGQAPAGGWTDAHLAELLEPFRPHRGRVVRLLMLGMLRGKGPRPRRRAPRRPLSAHRYW